MLHRVHWLAVQGLAVEGAFLVGIPLFLLIMTEIIKSKLKEVMLMKNNAISKVLLASTNVVSNLSGNLSGGALLANVFYGDWELKGLNYEIR